MEPIARPSQKAIDIGKKCDEAILAVLEKFQCVISYRNKMVISIPMGIDPEIYWAHHLFEISQGHGEVTGPRYKG